MSQALEKLTPAMVVRTVFPFADDNEVQYLLWEHTGWPSFWRTNNALQEIRASLLKYRHTLEIGATPCTFCDDPAEDGDSLAICVECRTAMKRSRRQKKVSQKVVSVK